jgi:hypothetical protein
MMKGMKAPLEEGREERGRGAGDEVERASRESRRASRAVFLSLGLPFSSLAPVPMHSPFLGLELVHALAD